MKKLYFPIRLKIMISLLLALTAVVIAITFTMANFFHEDKQSYMNDWTSIAVLSTARETGALLNGYTRQLRVGSLILLDDKIGEKKRAELLQGVFDNFPQLVEVTVHRKGKDPETVTDVGSLEAAGVSQEDLRAFRDEHPLPVSEILAGRTYVGNSTISPELPTLTLAVPVEKTPGEEPVLVSAVIRLDELLQLGAKFKVFEITLVTADGELLAHPDPGKVAGRTPADEVLPEVQAFREAGQAGLAREFSRNGVEMIGGLADVGVAGITATAAMPKSAAYLASRTLLTRLTLVAVASLFLVAIGGRLWARRVTRPIERLSSATRSIGQGRFDVNVEVRSRDEIGALAGSFNQMASELDVREKALEEAHVQLVQSEKMAAFGQLGAGIAHEIKNPLAGILGCAQLSLMEIEDGSELRENLTLIEKETERCKMIIENLLKFARQEKTDLRPTQINEVVHDAAAITNHQLEIHEVRLSKDLAEDLPLVNANGNQLQQVLINLIMNAEQAMEGSAGEIRVSTRRAGTGRVEILVSDTGPGIPPDIQTKLFEPFFTTKPAGKGTGLGLSVSFGIVRDHAGDIRVESEPGNGATFRITLPVAEAAPADAVTAPAAEETPTVVA